MRILAIDYGEKRIGLAVSDPLGITAQPYATLQKDGTEAKRILEIIKDKEVTKIIIGLPINMNGTKGESAARVEAFVEYLKTIITLDIELVDERLSTKEVTDRLIEFDMSREKRRQNVDKLAATLILETYLNRNPAVF
ncbi:MAG: Holliday junction resolvase RuvX [Elusimicrobia bacterium]|nr:Holliday junction resolvase RuvX [Elusimicrobiota bacterium]MBU2614708.1 Holliday junction resolvase RuvX [Elusimicrobiota bacterium]